MLYRKRCPFTGVVNFYASEDPFVSVGSVVKMAGLDSYRWHCFAGTETHAGAADDSRTAERRLLTEYKHVVCDGEHAEAA